MIGIADWKGRHKINIGSTTATSVGDFLILLSSNLMVVMVRFFVLFYIICFFPSSSCKVPKFPYPFLLKDWLVSKTDEWRVTHRRKTREPHSAPWTSESSDHLPLQFDFPLYPLSVFFFSVPVLFILLKAEKTALQICPWQLINIWQLKT